MLSREYRSVLHCVYHVNLYSFAFIKWIQIWTLLHLSCEYRSVVYWIYHVNTDLFFIAIMVNTLLCRLCNMSTHPDSQVVSCSNQLLSNTFKCVTSYSFSIDTYSAALSQERCVMKLLRDSIHIWITIDSLLNYRIN